MPKCFLCDINIKFYFKLLVSCDEQNGHVHYKFNQNDLLFIYFDTNMLNCIPTLRLASAEEELRSLRAKAGILSDYDVQVRRLREDIALLTGRRDALMRSSSTLREELPSYRPATPSRVTKGDDSGLSG